MSRGAPLAATVRQALAKRRFGADTDAFRWVNGEADGVPQVTVDGFGGVGVVSLYRDFTEKEEGDLREALVEAASPRALYLKRRPREARQSGVKQDELAPRAPWMGETVDELVARENGLSFRIRPPNGLSVGLYLDARELRRWVREQAQGKRLLNCFAYTCGFGVAACAGGASRAVNVDLSKRVLEWGKENAQLNGQTVDAADYVAGDVFEWLVRFRKRGESFDLVLLDPPSFATSKAGRFSAASDYARLVEAAAAVVAKDGMLLSCVNLSQLDRRRFEARVQEGIERSGRKGALLERLAPSPMDFPGVGNLKAVCHRLA